MEQKIRMCLSHDLGWLLLSSNVTNNRLAVKRVNPDPCRKKPCSMILFGFIDEPGKINPKPLVNRNQKLAIGPYSPKHSAVIIVLLQIWIQFTAHKVFEFLWLNNENQYSDAEWEAFLLFGWSRRHFAIWINKCRMDNGSLSPAREIYDAYRGGCLPSICWSYF